MKDFIMGRNRDRMNNSWVRHYEYAWLRGLEVGMIIGFLAGLITCVIIISAVKV